MKINVKKVIITFLLADLLVCIGIVIGIKIKDKPKLIPMAALAQERNLEFGVGNEKNIIEDNFWKFIKKSYIVVGSETDYQLYKIVSEVPRNDYDLSQFYYDSNGFMYYHDENGNRLSHVAVDISTFQGEVDFETLKRIGVDTVMIRVGLRGYGNGLLKADPDFEKNAEAANEAGLRIGVYFFSQALNEQEGREEAEFVLDLIKDYNITCPVTIDTEIVNDDEARTHNLDNASRTDGVVAFCETVKNAGYQPMIYASRNWFVQNLDMTRLGSYKLWVAQYGDNADFPYVYTGWQYTDQGTMSGVKGNIDLNIWFE